VAEAKAFLGKGWGFPVAADTSGEIDLAEYEEDVEQSVRIILGTNRGERVMRPDFGAGLDQFVFESLSANVLALIRHRVKEALIRWEPRIDVKEVSVKRNTSTAGQADIEVRYSVRATNTFYNLVYPFYLLEGADGASE
jgi:phage baseplate assembly protein W